MRINTIKIICILICVLTLTLTLSACNNDEEILPQTVNVGTHSETQAQTQRVTSTQSLIESDTQTSTEPSTDVPSEWCTDDILCKKPVIYLYPTKQAHITVKLAYPEKLTCSYPKYNDGWNVTAYPDGTLTNNKTGKELYSLYWEGNCDYKADFTEGFLVKGKDTIEFLEEKLAILGLSDKEAEEFIIYWLPILQENKYNFIRFAPLNEINQAMPLTLSQEPDTMIRVMMQYKPLNEYIEVKEQKLQTVNRTGFTVVEWGGCEIE